MKILNKFYKKIEIGEKTNELRLVEYVYHFNQFNWDKTFKHPITLENGLIEDKLEILDDETKEIIDTKMIIFNGYQKISKDEFIDWKIKYEEYLKYPSIFGGSIYLFVPEWFCENSSWINENWDWILDYYKDETDILVLFIEKVV